MTRKILITNDDGIVSDGIIRLAKTAVNFGEVWVVAPDSQCSGISHCITLRHPIEIHPHDFPVQGVRAFSCSGTPGDCVRVGSLGVMPAKPDVVLSGINYGYNVASDLQYSATAGAAFEAEFQGCLAIAFSEDACERHEITDKYLKDILEELLDEERIPGQIINVNFPGCAMQDFKGILRDRKVSGAAYFTDHYNRIKEFPDGGAEYMVEGVHLPEYDEGTDYAAVLDGYISIGRVTNIG
ncbi:MAG: 5'/3'-nucleotidase SurE [Lachnospiraceae bacterium]|nr:5'/3'-nucleotidase SurE [Lachnospiraceae bacterium]